MYRFRISLSQPHSMGSEVHVFPPQSFQPAANHLRGPSTGNMSDGWLDHLMENRICHEQEDQCESVSSEGCWIYLTDRSLRNIKMGPQHVIPSSSRIAGWNVQQGMTFLPVEFSH